MKVAAYTCILGEDCELFLDQYLTEVERLGVVFSTHLDRCPGWVAKRVRDSGKCVHLSEQPAGVPWTEMSRSHALDPLHGNHDWAVNWDIDETWEPNAPDKLRELDHYLDFDSLEVAWVNLWGDNFTVRVDLPSAPWRSKLFNLTVGRRWQQRSSVINGPCIMESGTKQDTRLDLVCLHHGLKTRELRELHKARWDRVYTRAVGRNPYGVWNYMLQEAEYPPVTEPLTEFLKTGRYQGFYK